MVKRIIKIIVLIAIVGYIAFLAFKKVDSMLLSDFDVINHQSLYAENGYPVYAKQLLTSSTAYFISDIALVSAEMSDKRMYSAYVDNDKRKELKVGYDVFVPKAQDVLRRGFQWDDTENYYMGKIISISNDINWETGLYRVNVRMNSVLPKEPFYSAKTVKDIKRNIIVAPIINLENTGGKYYAWLIDDESKAIRSEVVTGICDGYNCEIKRGIKLGDLLITSDIKQLENGLLLNNVEVGK